MTSATATTRYPSTRTLHGAARRRWRVQVDLLLAAAICLAGFRWGAGWIQDREASWVAAALRWPASTPSPACCPATSSCSAAGRSRRRGDASCSSILSVLGLTAITVAVLRGRGLHAVWGLVVACAALITAEDPRLAACAMHRRDTLCGR